MAQQLVIFDLDGTLMQTTEIDAVCYLRALADEAGIERLNQHWSDYHHVTDSGITEQIFREQLGRSPSPDEVARLQRRLVTLLESAFSEVPGSFTAVAGAAQALRVLEEQGDWAVAIATGSWRVSALTKLGLAEISIADLPAAFADDAHARAAIVSAAQARAQTRHGVDGFARVVCVGDAVWDVRTARDIGAAFVGVRVDGHDGGLRAHGATHVIRDFTDVEGFHRALAEAGVPHPPVA